MAAKSKHYDDVFEWIKQVIQSSKTGPQINACDRLINNFSNYCYNYIDPKVTRQMIFKLRSLLELQNEIFN